MCTPATLLAAYQGPCPFDRDGLIFLHRELQYTPGITPLALVWKDAACSRYLLDTDAAGQVPPRQQVTLEYRMDHTVATQDDPPVVLGRIPPAAVQQVQGLTPGALVRFSIGEQGVSFTPEGGVAGADLKFESVANQRRGRADSLSKVRGCAGCR